MAHDMISRGEILIRIWQSIVQQNDVLLENLDATKEQLEILLKQYGELEAKSKADVKVLVKEVGYNL